jgi:hypothetical protein
VTPIAPRCDERERSDRQHVRPASLDALNFLLSDVRGALGPYLNVFLVTQQHRSQAAAHGVRRVVFAMAFDKSRVRP